MAWYLKGLWFLGIRCDQFKNLIEAKKNFLEALNLNDTSGLSAYHLGMIYYHQHDTDKAEELLEQASVKGVRYADSTLSALYYSQGKNEEALLYLEKSAEDPSNIQARIVLVQHYLDKKIKLRVAYRYIDEVLSHQDLSEENACDFIYKILQFDDSIARRQAFEKYDKLKIEREDIEEKIKQFKTLLAS
ncbi:MAG: hypothetical protein HEEMFOPI_01840 [Holosporales bacterium]